MRIPEKNTYFKAYFLIQTVAKSKHSTRRWHAHPAFKYLTYIPIHLNYGLTGKYMLLRQASLEFMTDNRITLSKFKPKFNFIT